MFEVVEAAGEWIVRQGGREVARYSARTAALEAVSERMRTDVRDGPVVFALRFENPSAVAGQMRISK